MSGYTVQGFNPFLSDIDIQPVNMSQYGNNVVDTSMTLNPFLSGEVFQYELPQPVVSLGENPFLSSMIDSAPAPCYTGGNPFADFGVPLVPVAGPFMDTSEMNSNNWNLMETSYGSISEIEMLQPVSSSTQDLLSTVTGALEATSDSLLNRLRNAQPSPVPMPPSPTPSPRSPSPRSPSPDLLMGEEDLHSTPLFIQSVNDFIPKAVENTTTIDIMGLYNTPKENTLKTFTDNIPKAFIPEKSPQNPISLFDQDINMSMRSPQVLNIFDVAMDSTINPIPLMSTNQIIPLLMESKKVDDVEIITKKVVVEAPKVEAPKVETKVPERVPPARPAQPLPDRRPSPLPMRPPPPVPVSPRPVPVTQPIQMVEPQPIQNISKIEPVFSQSSAPMESTPTSASSTFEPSFTFSSPVVGPPPTVITPPKVEPTFPIPKKEPPSPFSMIESFPPTAPRSPRGMPPEPPAPRPSPSPFQSIPLEFINPEFESFEDRFNSISEIEPSNDQNGAFDSFAPLDGTTTSAWGDGGTQFDDGFSSGFGNNDQFDEFLALREPPPVPQSTPNKSKFEREDDDFDKTDVSLSITIRPQHQKLDFNLELVPSLAPPPKSPAISTGSAYSEDNGSFIPFLSSVKLPMTDGGSQIPRVDSQDSPQTPLFEEDQSQPLEDFPRIKFSGDGWEMQMRHPNKKKITGQRFWKKVYVRLVTQNDIPNVQIFNSNKDKDPIQEIPLQPCYSVSDVAAQQFDQYGKIFTVKLQYVFYKERPGVRPGQITKTERITTKLSQFAAYAIQGDYQGVKEFGSDLKKLGMPIEHAPQISQLVKLGTQNFEEMKQFSMVIEEALFRLTVHRDRTITYKAEEVQVTLVDEYYIEQDIQGAVTRQIARVRLYFLSFLSGAAEVELGINDIRRQGKEVVGRHDIIPIATEEWIRIEDIEFSTCVQLNVFDETKMVKFKPPDACYVELLRFRVRPPHHRELPLQVKTVFTTTGNRIEIRCDILVPGFTSRKLGQIPCEDVMVRIPIPECWIYMFRVEKHFRYGSVKSAHRRSGKVKGIERFLGAVEAVENSLMEVTSGQAKYEHQHKSIVWRVARLPKEGQGAYTTHSFFCHITLQQHEEIPENLTKHCYVEFTMPHTTISHTVCRSISVPMCDDPPEKCVKYLSRHEYVVEIEHTQGISPATYNLAAAVVKEEQQPPEVKPEEPMEGKAQSDSDFSDD